MNFTHTSAGVLISAVLVFVATWWVIAPRSYIACIRKVPLLWSSVYPMNTKSWFPQYLRVIGALLWTLMLLGFVFRFRRT